MGKDTSPHSLETMELLGHIDSCACDNVTWSALASVDTLCDNIHGPGHMTDRNLIRRLLNFDFLETNKFARLDLHD
jgi:hypothetical protein